MSGQTDRRTDKLMFLNEMYILHLALKMKRKKGFHANRGVSRRLMNLDRRWAGLHEIGRSNDGTGLLRLLLLLLLLMLRGSREAKRRQDHVLDLAAQLLGCTVS